MARVSVKKRSARVAGWTLGGVYVWATAEHPIAFILVTWGAAGAHSCLGADCYGFGGVGAPPHSGALSLAILALALRQEWLQYHSP